MATEYKLRTIKDIFDNVPPDRIDDCLKELRQILVVASNTAEMIRLCGEGEAGFEHKPFFYPFIFPDEIVWIDDGLGKVGASFSVKGEKPFMRLEIKKKKKRKRQHG